MDTKYLNHSDFVRLAYKKRKGLDQNCSHNWFYQDLLLSQIKSIKEKSERIQRELKPHQHNKSNRDSRKYQLNEALSPNKIVQRERDYLLSVVLLLRQEMMMVARYQADRLPLEIMLKKSLKKQLERGRIRLALYCRVGIVL